MIQTSKRETLESLLSLIFELQNETWHHENLDKAQTVAKLIQLAQILGLKTGPESPEFLSDLLVKVLEEYFKSPNQQPASIPPNLSELVEIYDKEEQEKKDRLQKSIASQEELKKYQGFVNRFKKVITTNTTKELPPKLVEQMAENAANETIASLPVVAQSDYFPKEDEKQLEGKIEEALQNELKKVGEELKIEKTPDEEKTTKEDKKIIEAEAIKIAAEPQIIEAVKETKLKKILPLPKEVLVKLNQTTEIIYPLPAYTLLNPKATTRGFIKKTVNRPSARLIEFAVKNAPPEWQTSKNWPIIQEMVEKRIFAENLQENVNFFKKMGVPTNHPLIQQFEDKIAKLLEVQKNPKTGQDYDWVKILKKDSATWSQGFNRFRSIVNTYERFSKFVTKGNYVPFLTPVRQFFYKKITQPIVGWLAKTAVGKAAQQGAKKAATWIAAKLGMKLAVTAGIAAAGAATGPPGWVVAAVTIGLDILKALGRKIIGFVKRIIQDPSKALGSVGVGVLLLIFIPSPLKLIAILPLAVGGLGLMTFIAAPATLGAIGGGVSAFFIAIAAIPIAAPIALFIIILFSVLAGLTLFIVLVVSGAFILPNKMAEVPITTISPYYSEYFEITKTASTNKIVSIPDDGETITYSITIRPKENYILSVSSLEEQFVVSKESLTALIVDDSDCQFTSKEVQEAIDSSQSLECSINIDSRFKDSVISNTATLKVGVKDNTGEPISGMHIGIANAMVIVGNPPMDCPSVWPTPFGYIGQGPGSLHTHYRQYKKEAIDIMVPNGTKVVATHQGTVVATLCDDVPGSGVAGGNVVKISGVCQGIPFTSWYMHLQNYSVKIGDKVIPGQQIGFSDSTSGGCPGATEHNTAQHLHYEFRTQPNEDSQIKMVFPYIPITVPRGCLGTNCGDISW